MTVHLRFHPSRSRHLGALSCPRLRAAVCPLLVLGRLCKAFPAPLPGCQHTSNLSPNLREWATPSALHPPEAPNPR